MKHHDDLWAIHIIGPDDIAAAPSFAEATAAAERFNRRVAALDSNGDVLAGATVYAEADPWPHGVESHAHSVKRDWPEYAK